MTQIPLAATTFDIATAIVAGYAALVATAGLTFNVFTWLREWQTRVVVCLSRMERLEPGAEPESIVLFKLVNHSGHLVKVTHVGLKPLKRGGHSIFIPQPLGLAVPGVFEIPARDAVTVWVLPESLTDYDTKHRTRAVVTTSDDQSFLSKRVRVGDLVH